MNTEAELRQLWSEAINEMAEAMERLRVEVQNERDNISGLRAAAGKGTAAARDDEERADSNIHAESNKGI